MDDKVKMLLEAAKDARFTLDHTHPSKGEEFSGSIERARDALDKAITDLERDIDNQER